MYQNINNAPILVLVSVLIPRTWVGTCTQQNAAILSLYYWYCQQGRLGVHHDLSFGFLIVQEAITLLTCSISGQSEGFSDLHAVGKIGK